MLSRGSRIAGSSSYSTSISSSARWAISSVSAATAATRSPTKRTLRSRLNEVQRAGDRVGLAGGGVDDTRHVLVGQHGVHAGQRARLARVDALDAAVRDRAVQDLADQHAAHLDVVGEGRLALRQLDRVHLRLRHADVLGLAQWATTSFGRSTVSCVAVPAGHRRLGGSCGAAAATRSPTAPVCRSTGGGSSPRIRAAARSTASTGLT